MLLRLIVKSEVRLLRFAILIKLKNLKTVSPFLLYLLLMLKSLSESREIGLYCRVKLYKLLLFAMSDCIYSSDFEEVLYLLISV
jgi:hypothetical protein